MERGNVRRHDEKSSRKTAVERIPNLRVSSKSNWSRAGFHINGVWYVA